MRVKIMWWLSLVIFLAFFIFLINAKAFFIISDSSQFKITGLTTAGGGAIEGGTFRAKIGIGQDIVGNVTNSNFRLCLGIFCTETFNPPYHINITGRLVLTNGTVLANTDLTVTVKYITGQWSTQNTTDGLGFFFIVIKTVPEYLQNKTFNISFTTQGSITAIYECTYNPTIRICS